MVKILTPVNWSETTSYQRKVGIAFLAVSLVSDITTTVLRIKDAKKIHSLETDLALESIATENLRKDLKDEVKISGHYADDLETAEAEIERLQALNLKQAEDLQEAEAEIERKRVRLQEATQRGSEALTALAQAKDDLEDADHEITSLNRQKAGLAADLQAAERLVEAQKSRIEDMESQMTAMATYFGSTETVDQFADKAIQMVMSAPTGGLDVQVQQ